MTQLGIYRHLILLLGLAGCATGVQVNDADLFVRQVNLANKVDDALGSFLGGLEKCGPSTSIGALTELHHGIAECSPPAVGGAVTCDVYMGDQLRGSARRSDVMLGRLVFSPATVGTDIRIGVQPWAGGRERVLDAWENLLRGRAQDVCPKKFSG